METLTIISIIVGLASLVVGAVDYPDISSKKITVKLTTTGDFY